MNKEDRVKSKELFNLIFLNGNKVSNKVFTIFFLNNNDNKKLFGISAPKKLGNAVWRNKTKRQVRHMIRDNKLLFKNNRNYVIIVKEAFLNNSFKANLESLQSLIGEMNEK